MNTPFRFSGADSQGDGKDSARPQQRDQFSERTRSVCRRDLLASAVRADNIARIAKCLLLTEQARCAIKAPRVADGARRLAGGMAADQPSDLPTTKDCGASSRIDPA